MVVDETFVVQATSHQTLETRTAVRGRHFRSSTGIVNDDRPARLASPRSNVAKALARSLLSPQDIWTLLEPMTGLAFVLFTFYMVSDPMTTPRTRQGQVIFGLATAAVYGLLTHAGIVFGLFFSLCLVCAARGGWMWWMSRRVAASALMPRIASSAGSGAGVQK